MFLLVESILDWLLLIISISGAVFAFGVFILTMLDISISLYTKDSDND